MPRWRVQRSLVPGHEGMWAVWMRGGMFHTIKWLPTHAEAIAYADREARK